MNYYKRKPYGHFGNIDAYYIYRIIDNEDSYLRIQIEASNVDYYKKGMTILTLKAAHDNDKEVPEWEVVLLNLGE